ncbi:MAG: hypothetical protein ACRD9R_10945 [Pyrinomonadaceae bacterium]
MPTKVTTSDLNLDNFPAAAVARYQKRLCLSCLFKLFTKQMGLAPRTAYTEIRRHEFSVAELTGKEDARPFFRSEEKNPRCPYCNSAKRWHARLDTYRIEGGKGTDAARRALVKSLPKTEEQFRVFETKTTRRAVFFEWLDALGRSLDLTDERWLFSATRAYLERKEPKEDWETVFAGVRAVRRSQRLNEGWERDGSRLFLAPTLYGEVLLVQYLVSRSQAHGGLTFEGRLTIHELIRRSRQAGLLDTDGSPAADQFEALEHLVEKLIDGDAPVKLHYIFDRRDLLEKAKTIYLVKSQS